MAKNSLVAEHFFFAACIFANFGKVIVGQVIILGYFHGVTEECFFVMPVPNLP